MMKAFFFALGMATCALLPAQTLDDNAEVLNEPRGESLFRLNKGVELYSYAPEDGWYRVRRVAYLKAAALSEDVIPAGTTLYDAEGEQIGEALSELKVEESKLEEGFRSRDRYQVLLEGYLFKTKFDDNSLVEKKVEELLNERNRSAQQQGFEALFRLYDFEEREFEDLTVHAYREEHKTLAEEKDFRILVIFKGASPYAVITKGHEVRPEKEKFRWEDGPYSAVYFYKPTARQQALVQDQILYTYLAL